MIKNIAEKINAIDSEFKLAVFEAWQNSDGTTKSFEEELNNQQWDYPDLPIEDILNMVTA